MTAQSNKLTLRHLDNGFYIVPDRHVKSLTIDGQLPQLGYEKRALPVSILNLRLRLEFFNWRVGQKWEERRPIGDRAQCWIQRTQHNKETIWALHIWEPA